MRTAHFYFSEEQLTKILEHLPNDDKIVRPMLQDGGNEIFRWNR